MPLAWTHLALDDLEAARRVAEAALPIAFNVSAEYLPDLYVCIGTILLALGEGDQAQTSFLQAVQQISSASAPTADGLSRLGTPVGGKVTTPARWKRLHRPPSTPCGSLRSSTFVLRVAPKTFRLEWTGTIVHGLCSADGQQWYSVGNSNFAEVESAEVGLYAIGNIDRSLYPGAFSQGSAIGFDGFWQWR